MGVGRVEGLVFEHGFMRLMFVGLVGFWRCSVDCLRQPIHDISRNVSDDKATVHQSPSCYDFTLIEVMFVCSDVASSKL